MASGWAKAGPESHEQGPARWAPWSSLLPRRTRSLGFWLVLLLACLLALVRAPGWTNQGLLSSHPDLQAVDATTRPDNVWAGHQLPHGHWPEDRFLVGAGKADITGPVVELNMMGYADFNQVGSGVRQRLYSRAFIVGSLKNAQDRFVYLVLDIQSGDTAVRYGILRALAELGPRYSMYGHDNIAVTATHSHSGPGAWLNYLLPQITSKGFDRQSYRAIVDGCILSIRRAHESLEPGSLSVGTTKIYGAGLNRSLFAYLANPENERARYNASAASNTQSAHGVATDDGSVETDMTLLKLQRESDGRNIGILTWFPTHGTSMQANNTLITGDNKGLAADLFEKAVRGGVNETDSFVAGFSQANMGDVTPNVLGAWCNDGTGHDCRFEDSTCSDGRSNNCRARGPGQGNNDYGVSSCFEIAKRQYQGALRIYQSLKEQTPNVRGDGVKAIHHFHDMSTFRFQLANGTTVRTCPAALGYSFAAGTWDEPGRFDLVQHLSAKTNSSPIWKALTWLLKPPGPEQVECQAPKSILLDVGEVKRPYEWTPNIVDIQTLRVGHLIIIVSPGEATTMAGRRWKEAVAGASVTVLAHELKGQEPVVVIGAPSNSYTHYITTEEEYGVQRYEGASTLYGKHTLAAYINRSLVSLQYLGAQGAGTREALGPSVLPPDNSNRSLSFIPGVVFDRTPWTLNFGDVVSDVAKGKFARGETARATFVGANPRNNLRLEQTYAAVEQRQPGRQEWRQVRDDSDWALTFHWRRRSKLLGTSEASVAWQIEPWAAAGEYRLRYYGDYKAALGGGRIEGFEGVSRVFRVSV